MAKVYAELIRKGIKTLEQVPLLLQPQVREILGIQNDEGGGIS